MKQSTLSTVNLLYNRKFSAKKTSVNYGIYISYTLWRSYHASTKKCPVRYKNFRNLFYFVSRRTYESSPFPVLDRVLSLDRHVQTDESALYPRLDGAVTRDVLSLADGVRLDARRLVDLRAGVPVFAAPTSLTDASSGATTARRRRVADALAHVTVVSSEIPL